MIYNKKLKTQKGFAALYLAVLILVVVFSIGISINVLTLTEHKILKNITKSCQAYYTAEAGIEDALLRLSNNMNWSSHYNLNVNNNSASIDISDILGGSRTITSEGDVDDRIRKVQIVYRITTEKISFYYGAQIGDGGMEMMNNSRVKGNVFSNGSVIAPIKGYIDNSIQVAKNGNRIEGLIVDGDAWAHTCKDSTIVGDLTYVSGGSVNNCPAGGLTKTQPNDIDAKDLPISQSTIDDWKTEAESGGIIVGDYTISGGTVNLGPQKITGNLTLDNNAVLTMTGTIWVVGDVLVKNGSTINLDANFYGGVSGVLISDGKIKIRPGVTLEGSGVEGSYLMLLSTNNSVDQSDPAIEVDNTTTGGIFYTTQGLVVIRNNVEVREVTCYQLYLAQNAEIDYETGLADTEFTSGPGGSWTVASWKEVQ